LTSDDRRPLPAALGPVGVWRNGNLLSADFARLLERLGYPSLWIGGSPVADLELPERLLAATDRLTVATGVVNIRNSDPALVADSYHRVESRFPGRFLLGIGAGHPERRPGDANRPHSAMTAYLDRLDHEGVPRDRRVVAALGPRMLRLAGERSAGAHSYLVTPAHTALAREILGAVPLLAPEQRVVLSREAGEARAIARANVTSRYRELTSYRMSLRRLGYTEQDLAGEASDGLIDDLVAHGRPEAIAARIAAQHEAGADHVAIQLLTPPGERVERSFASLAEVLLSRPG
jgi:probable F420-dependent oxidoreductase